MHSINDLDAWGDERSSCSDVHWKDPMVKFDENYPGRPKIDENPNPYRKFLSAKLLNLSLRHLPQIRKKPKAPMLKAYAAADKEQELKSFDIFPELLLNPKGMSKI